MSQFSSNETTSLEKTVNLQQESFQCPLELIEKVYELERCVSWIKEKNYNKICLQFPDHLLCDSAQVSRLLQEKLQRNVYVLADTAYESCCIDYVAAEHIQADAIIHFGPVCFSQTSQKIPYLNIYEKQPLVIEEFLNIYREKCKNYVILLDTPFIHLENEFCHKIQRIDSDSLDLQDENVVFICDKHRKLLNFQLAHKPKTLFYYNEREGLLNFEQDSKLIKRRYFLVEKIKDSQTIGIVIGTLGVKNYLEQIERLKKLIELHKKKYYLISVGKPTVSKLANFPEIDIYVIVTCSMNEIYDSRDYYKPIATPYDIELALNRSSQDLSFTYDFNSYVNREICREIGEESDVSLISGKIRGNEKLAEESTAILLKEGALLLSSGPGYLSERSWKGLEQNLGDSEVRLAEEGRKGVAQHYHQEPN